MDTWSEAFSRIWGNFTGVFNEGSARLWRMLFWLLLLGGSAFAVWNYRNMLILTEDKVFTAQSSGINIAADQKRLDAMFREVQEAANRRSNSSMTVETMRDAARYAFNDPLLQMQLMQQQQQASSQIQVPDAADLAAAAATIPQEVVIVPPPAITVKAIMTLGNTRMAVMDIEGSGRGLIVQAGNMFQGRKGRIVRIDNDKVVVRWDGKDWNIAPEF